MTIEEPEALGPFVADVRKRKKWTQKQLAKRADCSQSTISRFERGLLMPDLRTLMGILTPLCMGLSLLEKPCG